MSRPLKKLTCGCCGKTEVSICINCIEKDMTILNEKIKDLEKKVNILEDPLNKIFVDKHAVKDEESAR